MNREQELEALVMIVRAGFDHAMVDPRYRPTLNVRLDALLDELRKPQEPKPPKPSGEPA